MDPLTQGSLGSVAGQAACRRPQEIRAASAAAFLAGMAPDLDVLIRSESDPLLFLEYHRHFTHALVFIPIGALAVAAVLYPLLKKWAPFGRIYLYCLAGYATHGLLDACTSWGTMLLWPFSDIRVAWNNISIIDPLLTLPLLGLLIWGYIRQRRIFGAMALFYAVLYLCFGLVQHYRARQVALEMAQSRGHVVAKLTVKPTFANLVLWRAIYLDVERDLFYVDAVRVGLFSGPQIYSGGSVPLFNLKDAAPGLSEDSRLAVDVARFSNFSDGYLALHPEKPNLVGDLRYALLPNSLNPLWGIEIDLADPQKTIQYLQFREGAGTHLPTFQAMVLGRPLPSPP